MEENIFTKYDCSNLHDTRMGQRREKFDLKKNEVASCLIGRPPTLAI